jgi:3'-phosphoadenosine 5'-phosphosulfate sulfotransferase (PAPS reductase)/FAD synthetase
MKLLGRKQTTDHAAFVSAMSNIERTVSRAYIDSLIAQTAREIAVFAAGKRVAFGWSGGKDSIALEHVCTLAGVAECVLVISELEYPAFLQWATNNMPAQLEVVSTGQDIEWLKAHPNMLFPKDAATAGAWFRMVQHRGQERYYRAHNLDGLIVGRRNADGNMCGRNGVSVAHGIVRYSPIRAWRHEDILALIHYYKKPLPPTYGWPRGYRVGTGPWPARQWTLSEDHGFAEVWTIDKDVVRGAAAAGFVPARAFMQKHGLV